MFICLLMFLCVSSILPVDPPSSPFPHLQVIYTSFGGTSKGLHFNNLIVGLVLLTRGRDEEKAKCKSPLFFSSQICFHAVLMNACWLTVGR